MAAIARGERGAVERLYDAYSPTVFAIALRVLRDRAAAEELLNDVFVEVWTHRERFDATRGSVASYLATLTRSRGIDRLRANRRRAGAPIDERTMAAPAPTPEEPTGGEDRQRTVAALARLTPDQRSALELAYFEGLSHSEVAARLERPLGTVKTHIRQGLIQLRDLLRMGREGRAS